MTTNIVTTSPLASERTRITVHILIMPVIALLVGLLLAHRDNLWPQTLSLCFFYLWIATTLVCFVRGITILRQHRYLAWGCFTVALGQVGLAVAFSIIPHWRPYFQL
jgi:hypothetical protein